MGTENPIIMVDDDDTDRLLASRCFRKVGSTREFIALDGGASLLEYMERVERNEAALPAVVLLDINMPGMDGFATLDRLRKNMRYGRLPVITMLTHSERPKDETRTLQLGANAFKTKPDTIAGYVRFLACLDRVAADGAACA